MILSVRKYILFLTSSIFAACLSYLTSKYLVSHYTFRRQAYQPSSVWCNFGPLGERLCRFRNICYDPHFQEFQFYVSDESVISGVQRPELWKNIDMSTVLGHNAFKMKVSILSPTIRNDLKTVHFQNSPTFIIHRFKSDNIMHVIHDDLIPLHFTIESIFDKTAILEKQISLAFSDNNKQSVLDKWYSHYSGTDIIMLASRSEKICFVNAYVGLLRATLWFNYGFKQQQGPYINDNFSIRGLTNFVAFNLNAWQAKYVPAKFQYLKVVVLVRSQSRRILNRDVLSKAIKRAHAEIYPTYKLDIVEVDFALNDTSLIISHLKQAKLLVGMHGAGMILSLFLPPASAVVELFPFGINPDNVSFLKALLKQRHTYHFNYECWQNRNRENSVPGPQTELLMGKISHLSQSTQDYIKHLSEVPAVHCCHDPAYLYYIYHDTYVDDNIYYSILKALKENKYSSNSILSENVFPSLPVFLTCKVSNDVVSIKWGASSNSNESEDLWFQLTLQNGDEVFVQNVTNNPSNVFIIKVKNPAKVIQVWFQPFNNKNVGGHIKYTNCESK